MCLTQKAIPRENVEGILRENSLGVKVDLSGFQEVQNQVSMASVTEPEFEAVSP